jgi:hypothetical protein
MMFEHLTLLLSFIYVIALTHLLSSSTGLIVARDRVRSTRIWSVGEISLDFSMATIQYFTCSLVSIEVKGDQEVDMISWHDKQRVPILSAFAILGVIATVSNYHHRNIGGGDSDLIKAEALIVPLVVLEVLAILYKTKWLQWVTAIVLLIGLVLIVSSTGTFS